MAFFQPGLTNLNRAKIIVIKLEMRKYIEKHSLSILIVSFFSIVGLGALNVYQYKIQTTLRGTHAELTLQYENLQHTLSLKEQELTQYGTNLEEIRQAYALSEENGSELLQLLTDEKNKNDVFEEQIEDITGTVGQLDKLSKIDPELLMKYSKVSFLNEHYAPEKVAEITSTFRFKTDEPEYIHSKISRRLNNLLEDAQEDGISLLIVSGYRSFDEQKSLKSAYSVQYGFGANAFSADQGYSEHQLGTTVDFTTTEVGGGLNGFETTNAYTWLIEHAHEYGFVLSYPKDNAYYIFEPWHWRFVGEDLANDLHDDKKYFYDLGQREIDEYLISLFD